MKCLLIFAALVALAAANRCNRSGLSNGLSCESCANSWSLGCGDGTSCQCTALIWNRCGVPSHSDNWRPGLQAIHNCGIPIGTPVATFSNERYDWRNDLGHAGIFMGCSGDGIMIWDQWCGATISNRFYPRNGWDGGWQFVFRTSAANYFVINP